ncbi:sigma-70 family RNA polymerase sigma factor [Chryseomicrobium palamuruense]
MKTRPGSLEDLYRQYAKPLYLYLLKLSGSPPLAEDLTQETFVRATISLHTYEGEEARAWLFKVARNVYLDEWRKRKKRQGSWLGAVFRQQEMISPDGKPEDLLLQSEQAEEANALLAFLPEQYRTILYLREYEEFTYEEIAEAMQLSLDQVKVSLHRARKRYQQLAQRKGWNPYEHEME